MDNAFSLFGDNCEWKTTTEIRFKDKNLNDKIGNLLALQTYEERKEFAEILLGNLILVTGIDPEEEHEQVVIDFCEALSLVANEINGD